MWHLSSPLEEAEAAAAGRRAMAVRVADGLIDRRTEARTDGIGMVVVWRVVLPIDFQSR